MDCEHQVDVFELTPIKSCPDEVVSAWADLALRCNVNPTLAPPWSTVIMDSLAPETTEARALLRKDTDGRLSGVLPFVVSRRRMWGLAIAVLEPCSNLFSYHAEIVAESDAGQMLSELARRLEGWDVLHFANVVVGSPTEAALLDLAGRQPWTLQSIEGDASPYMPVAGSWQDYLSGRNKKFRYKHRQRREQFDKSADFTVRWFTEREGVGDLLNDMLSVEDRSWKSSAGLAIAQHERERGYHQMLLPMLAGNGSLLGLVLYRRGLPIAFSLCSRVGGWVGHLKTSFDQAYAHLSPGAYVIDLSVEWAFREGANEFDFLGGAASHKMAWTSTIRSHRDHFLFARTPKGWALGKSKQLIRSLREAARNLRASTAASVRAP